MGNLSESRLGRPVGVMDMEVPARSAWMAAMATGVGARPPAPRLSDWTAATRGVAGEIIGFASEIWEIAKR